MGTFNLSAEDISNILINVEDEGWFEGDFSEKEFMKGARQFIKELRKQGANIPK